MTSKAHLQGIVKRMVIHHMMLNKEKKTKKSLNKDILEDAIQAVEAFCSVHENASFSLVEAIVGNYSSLGKIYISCAFDGKWIKLFPKTGSLVSSMSEHLMSKKHVEMVAIQDSTFVTEEDQLGRKIKGRPEKTSIDDRKQKQIV